MQNNQKESNETLQFSESYCSQNAIATTAPNSNIFVEPTSPNKGELGQSVDINRYRNTNTFIITLPSGKKRYVDLGELPAMSVDSSTCSTVNSNQTCQNKNQTIENDHVTSNVSANTVVERPTILGDDAVSSLDNATTTVEPPKKEERKQTCSLSKATLALLDPDNHKEDLSKIFGNQVVKSNVSIKREKKKPIDNHTLAWLDHYKNKANSLEASSMPVRSRLEAILSGRKYSQTDSPSKVSYVRTDIQKTQAREKKVNFSIPPTIQSPTNEEHQTEDFVSCSSFSFPPQEDLANILLMLSLGVKVSMEELDDVIAFVKFLKVTNLVAKSRKVKNQTFPEMAQSLGLSSDEPKLKCPLCRLGVQKKMKPWHCIADASPPSPPPSTSGGTAFRRKSIQNRGPDQAEEKSKSKLEQIELEQNDPDDSSPPPSSSFPQSTKSRKRRQKNVFARTNLKDAFFALAYKVTCEICGSQFQPTYVEKHAKHCNGVLIRRPHRTNSDSPLPPEERRERTCPKCDKVMICDKDFEIHMAVVHKAYWRLEFDNEAEYLSWFEGEGFGDSMCPVVGGNSTLSGTTSYVCAYNLTAPPRKLSDGKCPCRMVVKKTLSGITVRFNVLHNHSERFSRFDACTDHNDAEYCDQDMPEVTNETYSRTRINESVSWDNRNHTKIRRQRRK